MPKYSEYEYMYASVKIAAVSGRLATPSKLQSLCEAASADELSERISELGIKPVSNENGFDAELTLDGWLNGEYEALLSYLPDPEPVRLMRSRYDCHNIKTAIKCRFLGISPDKFFIDCGNVSAADCAAMANSRDFSLLGTNLRAAAEEADRLIDGTKDARTVDVLIDRACFEDMKAFSAAFGFAPVSELLALKTDLTNIMSALRVMKIRSPEKAAQLLCDSLISGGKIDTEALKAAKDADGLAAAANGKVPGVITDSLKRALDDGLDEVGRIFDTAFIREAHRICSGTQLGASPVADYILSLEYQVKNLRIIISGVSSGNEPDIIRERLRV